jgi:hypothetical protein
MSVLRRCGLLVDDPLAAGEERSPAAPATSSSEIAGRLRDIPIGEIHANPGQRASGSTRGRWPGWRTRSASGAFFSR